MRHDRPHVMFCLVEFKLSHGALLASAVVAQGLAFAVFAEDKRRSRSRRQRVPERALLVLCALGPVGAWLAVAVLRHKARKLDFLLEMTIVSALLPAVVVACVL